MAIWHDDTARHEIFKNKSAAILVAGSCKIQNGCQNVQNRQYLSFFQ